MGFLSPTPCALRPAVLARRLLYQWVEGDNDMARTEQEMTELLVEHVAEPNLGEITSKNPMVLSCGGMFIPRPKAMGPKDELYKVLNTPSNAEPTKLVSGNFSMNLLQDVLHKESMN